ncbi:MAG: NCS1 family nucleobase:cation symporter-1 [Acidobacteria bacterium]|nr:NCS1 family nucleobase:cation symporter-1 [Acidobacteriota bacterium]
MVELLNELPPGPLSNPDIAPTTIAERTWSTWHIASLWIAMSICIPTYMLAANMVEAGLSWRQSLLVISLGNTIVLVPLLVNGHAGTKYGIPFPAYARAAFGTRGAHVPSLLRAVVACGWFGIQTWIGGLAISAIMGTLWGGWNQIGGGASFMGHRLPDFLGFFLFWLINMYFVYAGTEWIKWLETLAAPFLIVVGLALFVWATRAAGGIGAILEQSDRLSAAREDSSRLVFMTTLFIPWLTAMVGFWATLALSIPDFSRYARSQKDQFLGQTIGLLTAMPLVSFVGISVTSATVILYGEAMWNPVDLVSRLSADYESPLVGVLAMFALVLATLSTNIAANVVAPANSFSNLVPERISFRVGGLIAGTIGILIFPWRLLDMYQTWLISYSGLLGAAGGVIVCDYLLIRRTELDLPGLYGRNGTYDYKGGFNPAAIAALTAGILVALAGKLHPALAFLFNGAWFSAATVSFFVYLIMMKKKPTTETR